MTEADAESDPEDPETGTESGTDAGDETDTEAGGDGSGASPETPTPEPAKRGELLELLETDIREAHRKATSGRVYNAENEKVRQGWFRVHGYLAGQYRQLARDTELEDLRDELESIKDEYGFET